MAIYSKLDRNFKKHQNIIGGLMFVFLIVMGICMVLLFLIDLEARRLRLAPFESHLSEYLEIPGLIRIQGNAEEIKGKLIIIDQNEQKLDRLLYQLPDGLIPATPEEVGTVVWIECVDIKIGHYSDGSDAIQQRCNVTLIDKAKSAIIAEVSFSGSDPVQVKSSGGSRTGDKPERQIIKYLSDLCDSCKQATP